MVLVLTIAYIVGSLMFIREDNPIWDIEKQATVGLERDSYEGLPSELGVELPNH